MLSEMHEDSDWGQQQNGQQVVLRTQGWMKKAAIINPELLFINGHGFVNIDESAPAWAVVCQMSRSQRAKH